MIAAITVLHLLAGKTLTQQYRLQPTLQDTLNRHSIQQLVAYQIDQGASTITLPTPLSTNYSLSYQTESNGSITYTITKNDTQKTSEFNINIDANQANNSSVDLSNVTVNTDDIQNIKIQASSTTHLIGVRTVWYPRPTNQQLNVYNITTENDALNITVNATVGQAITLSQPLSSTQKNIDLYFSNLLEDSVISLYLKYSDGSIQHAIIQP
jgi:hypothetical protein